MLFAIIVATLPVQTAIMKKIRSVLEGFYYSLPIQMLMIQFRNHKSILFFWLMLILMVTQGFGSDFGIPYLFLEPEYMGEIDFWSFLLVGMGLGAFIASYQIAMYILDSYRFPFLALENSPFFIFFLNNSLLPFIFILLYSKELYDFHVYNLGEYQASFWAHLGGMYLGIVAVLVFLSAYFFKTNKNLVKVFGSKFVQELRRPRTILTKAKASVGRKRERVDFFLFNLIRIGKVDKSVPADFRTMVKVLNQNHGNALFLELILLVVIVALGLLEENPSFQIPAGMSIFLFFAILLMFFAAFTFWFRKIGVLAILLVVGIYFAADSSDYFDQRHPALGMNYSVPPAKYNLARLNNLVKERNAYSDYLETLIVLDKWKKNYQEKYGADKKPKALFICTSGGGLRASYFTMRCLEKLDSVSGGEFMDQTRLMSGASGGMVGSALFRELYLQKQLGVEDAFTKEDWSERISRDLLNRILFKIVTGTFLPGLKTEVGGRAYASDRGFSLDQQMQRNLYCFDNKRLAYYEKYEKEAIIPHFVLSPVVINDGRKLYISSSNCAYLCNPLGEDRGLVSNVNGIEFRRFFREQEADSLLFVTALRMNASFPFITPYIHLPSYPPMQVIDAGVIDNFGIQTAVKYLYNFRNWFAQNTDGVMILQIRDSEKKTIDQKSEKKSLIGRIMDPIGSTYQSYSMTRDQANDEYLNFLGSFYDGDIELLTLKYTSTDTLNPKASLSWHLTDREISHIESAVQDAELINNLEKVDAWLDHE